MTSELVSLPHLRIACTATLRVTVACGRRAALELAPGHPRLHKLLGSARFAMGDLAGAEAALRRALELRPDYADAW